MQSERSSREYELRKFVVATFFDGAPQDGGGYTHKRNMLSILRQVQRNQLQFTVICGSPEAYKVASESGLRSVIYKRSVFQRIACKFLALNFIRRIAGRLVSCLPFSLDAYLNRHQIDLVLFLGPDSRALELLSHNFVFSVWDLCHLDHPEFPEVAHFGEFERREYMYTNVLPRAVAVITDSNIGRSRISEHYGVSMARVHAAPFLVDERYRQFSADKETASSIALRFGIRQPYVFYPAQFWPHKNHKYILEAVALMDEKMGWKPQVVFSGADKGALLQLKKYAVQLGVQNDVVFCGFVEDEFMPYLYKGAMALVMPTYFGPTNIPPLEARALGVPVCYSDFCSFREQLGNSAYYVDLEDPMSLANALGQIRTNDLLPAVAVEREQSATDSSVMHIDLLNRIFFSYIAKVMGVYAIANADL